MSDCRRSCQQITWADRSRIGIGKTPHLPHERHVDAADVTVEDESRFHTAGARYDARDCGVVFAAAPSHIPFRSDHYHAAGSDVAVVRRECFCVVGAIEDQVVSGGDLYIALDLNFSDELSRECASDSDDPCALGAGSPYASFVFALPDDAWAGPAAYAEYAGCLRPVAVVTADDGAVIGGMPHTSHSLALCTLPENALRGAIVGTDHGAVIRRVTHTPDSLALRALPENALPGAEVATDDGAVIGGMRHTPDSLALCTLPENALPSALVGTDDAAVIGGMRRTPDSLAVCTLPENCGI
ncbi:hypothetical protein [Streptomyces sp. NPDC005784]|uniref:hypothetical protein n=1 Tax=Streptomyces sp. NPDC005784 TaxID=3364731 RepID=UPI0036B4335B